MTPAELLLKSVKRRQKDGPRELAELLNKEDADQKKREEINSFHSRAWNRRKKEMQGSVLPDGWRDLHHKTLIKLASEKTGTEIATKDEAVEALEAFEHGGN